MYYTLQSVVAFSLVGHVFYIETICAIWSSVTGLSLRHDGCFVGFKLDVA